MAWRWIWLTVSIFLPSILLAKSEIKFREQLIHVGKAQIKVELAENEEQWQRGLMYRNHLDQDRGMLFVFPNEEPRSFWMKNTFVPLDIGYFDSRKKLIEIHQMEPVPSEMSVPKSYPSESPSMYALEANQGWFKKNKVKVGDSLRLPGLQNGPESRK